MVLHGAGKTFDEIPVWTPIILQKIRWTDFTADFQAVYCYGLVSEKLGKIAG